MRFCYRQVVDQAEAERLMSVQNPPGAVASALPPCVCLMYSFRCTVQLLRPVAVAHI